MKSYLFYALAIYAALTSGASHGQTFSESADAGTTERTAAIVAPKVNRITGTLKPGTGDAFQANPVDVDVYAFTISQPTDVVIEAKSNGFDMNLLLLKEGFFGLYGDDDGGMGNGGLDSKIPNDGNPLILPPGTYYVAVGDNNIGAFTPSAVDAGDSLWNNDSNLLTGGDLTTPIAFIGAASGPDASTGQAYEILFNFTTVVTGLDLSAGKKPSALKGANILNNSGSRQTAKVSGNSSARFLVKLTNSGDTRVARGGLTKASQDADVTVKELGPGGKNVTAAFKKAAYTKSLPSGASQQFSLTVKTPGSGLKSKVLVTMRDKSRKSISDTAGANLKFD